jgi:hypothetical protein
LESRDAAISSNCKNIRRLDHMSWACDAMRDVWEAEIKEIHEGAKAVVSTKIAD